ncbi:hypothetical protein B0H10DRAFT_2214821 [Mycena sp. CBHHK59/15]|nr:hypothetical protein B0H10DRAFT_2214821 [Mycena sp. CBHHK59/15]
MRFKWGTPLGSSTYLEDFGPVRLMSVQSGSKYILRSAHNPDEDESGYRRGFSPAYRALVFGELAMIDWTPCGTRISLIKPSGITAKVADRFDKQLDALKEIETLDRDDTLACDTAVWSAHPDMHLSGVITIFLRKYHDKTSGVRERVYVIQGSVVEGVARDSIPIDGCYQVRIRCPEGASAEVKAFFDNQVNALNRIVDDDVEAIEGDVTTNWVCSEDGDMHIKLCYANTDIDPEFHLCSEVGTILQCQAALFRVHKTGGPVLQKEYFVVVFGTTVIPKDAFEG